MEGLYLLLLRVFVHWTLSILLLFKPYLVPSFPLNFSPSSLTLLLHFTPVLLLCEIWSLPSSLEKMSRQSWQSCSERRIGWSVYLLTGFGCLCECASAETHFIRLILCVLCVFAFTWSSDMSGFPAACVSGGLGKIALALRFKKKTPLRMGIGQTEEWKLHDWDVWDGKKG